VNLAVIPARGGSKRIPRKNIKPFHGRPIIAYSIAAALECGLFADVVVSTDDEEIAAVARASGATVPFMRPAALADDFVGMMPVVRHAIEALAAAGKRFEYVCCICSTAPFLSAETLRAGYELLRASGKQFAFSVTRFPAPVWRGFRLCADGGVEPLFPEFVPARSQDLEEAYHDAGQFYWGQSKAFSEALPVFAPHSAPLVLPRHRVQDIDAPEDWELAERLLAATR
jgi:N-acylneuraminate cytidylyltransferase